MSRLATLNSSHEKAYKYNVGIDGTLLRSLNFTVEGFYQRRNNIWVSSDGKYTNVVGVDFHYENEGVVDSWGGGSRIRLHKKSG